MKKRILIRFGDMMLKGHNIGFFIKRVRKHIMMSLADLSVSYVLRHDRIMIDYDQTDEPCLISRLKRISGIHDFSVAHVTTPDLEAIIQAGISLLDETAIKEGTTFKMETRRTNKSFPMTSLEITQNVAKAIIGGTKHRLVVDVNNPELTLYLELRVEAAYLYINRIKGMGGYPYATGGKGLLMMSGGIDSPVAGYLSMKQGIEVELIHFESTPLTPIESVQKVIDLAEVLASYTIDQKIMLHLVPFAELHHSILDQIPEPYMITVMRRMMYRIAERFTHKKKIYCLINGESVGQVASQTLQSMQVVEAVTKIPVLRPLITNDKLEIIELSKQIGAYDISIKPFNDCCSIYVPKQPVTKPMEVYASKYETYIPYEPLIEETMEKIISISIGTKDKIDLSTYGFETKEAIERYQKEMSEMV